MSSSRDSVTKTFISKYLGDDTLSGTVRKRDDLPTGISTARVVLKNIHVEDGVLGNLPDNGRLRRLIDLIRLVPELRKLTEFAHATSVVDSVVVNC